MRSKKKQSPGEQVVVITGASSGIGRETALLYAEAGARVVIGSRDDEELREVAAEIEAKGGRAHVVVTDVRSREDLEALGDAAVAQFGRVDTWINNAAVEEWALLEEHEPQEVETIIRTNLLGAIYGTQIALDLMRSTDSGTIINIGSVESRRALPLQSVYAASKHGVLAFTRVLRMELMHRKSGIDAVLILPSSIDTPLFEHAVSHMEVEPRPAPPVYHPRVVAEAIVRASTRPQAEIVVGGGGKAMTMMERIMPFAADRLTTGTMFRAQRSRDANRGRDNFAGPSEPHGTTGGWNGRRSSAYTRMVESRPVVRRALILGGVAGIAALVIGGARSKRPRRSSSDSIE